MKVHKNLLLGILALAQFMVVLDASIVNVALPAIMQSLNFSVENVQWIVTAYTLAFGGFLLFGGRAADLFGRRKMFLAGLIVFTIASMFVGAAQNELMMIAARAVQGLAAAFMSPAALSIVLTEFKEGRLVIKPWVFGRLLLPVELLRDSFLVVFLLSTLAGVGISSSTFQLESSSPTSQLSTYQCTNLKVNITTSTYPVQY